MVMGINGNAIISEINEIARTYVPRDDYILKTYGLLRMDDDNEQSDMESFVSNDPRTLWNMSTYLLTPRPPQFQLSKRDGSQFGRDLRQWSQRIQDHFVRVWSQQNRKASRQGKNGFTRSLVGSFLSSGWFFVSYGVGSPLPFVDYWSPLSTFPVWSEYGLSRLARRRQISVSEAIRRADANGWDKPEVAMGSSQIWEYHLYKSFNEIEFNHTVVMGTKIVKPWTLHSGVIPVVAGIAGGLPGNQDLDREWPKNQGQPVLATNERVYNSQNRQHTFLQQMIRDTANPRWFERSSGQPILRPEDMFRRGAIFRGGVNDDIGPLAVPPIPVEARSSLFDVGNMIQRGGVSDITFGNVQQQVSSVLMSQAAESTAQLLDPYKTQIEFIYTEVTDFWWQDMVNNSSSRPEWMKEAPSELFNDTEITSTYAVKIPGDMQSRILMAKALNSDFKLSIDRVLESLFPEVTNKQAERASQRADVALLDPSFYLMTVIQAHEARARESAQLGNQDTAMLHLEMAQAAREKVKTLVGTPPSGSAFPQAPMGAPPTMAPGAENQAVAAAGG